MDLTELFLQTEINHGTGQFKRGKKNLIALRYGKFQRFIKLFDGLLIVKTLNIKELQWSIQTFPFSYI